MLKLKEGESAAGGCRRQLLVGVSSERRGRDGPLLTVGDTALTWLTAELLAVGPGVHKHARRRACARA